MFYYDVYPRMVPADEVSEIRIRPRYAHAAFHAEKGLKVTHSPYDRTSPLKEIPWRMDGETLVFELLFESEQEHCITVEEPLANGAVKKTGFRLYSLKPDWYALRPFKGDIHLHSTRSDGSEEGRYIAARYREAGFDFMALTDHRLYEPSVEVRDYWSKINPDFKLFPGEEVHSPDNPVHIVNFGGRFSVNALYREDEQKYRKEVAEIMEKIPDRIPGKDYFPVAASEWVFGKIREAGGLAVFCHPYWSVAAGNVNPEWVNDEILRRRKFDAYELIGGFYSWQYHSNNLQAVRYYEEQAKGNVFPAVGVSDCHGVDSFPFDAAISRQGRMTSDSSDATLFNWYYTIVLAEECELPSLIANVRKCNCMAVCAPSGERPEVFGSLRAAKYGHFLLRDYFPQLRSFATAEGLLMQHHLAGQDSLEALRALRGRTQAYRELCFKR